MSSAASDLAEQARCILELQALLRAAGLRQRVDFVDDVADRIAALRARRRAGCSRLRAALRAGSASVYSGYTTRRAASARSTRVVSSDGDRQQPTQRALGYAGAASSTTDAEQRRQRRQATAQQHAPFERRQVGRCDGRNQPASSDEAIAQTVLFHAAGTATGRLRPSSVGGALDVAAGDVPARCRTSCSSACSTVIDRRS